MTSRSRREFLATAAAALVARKAVAAETNGSAPKKLQGVFPIMQTPFLESGALDTATLANEVHFLHRTGAQGMTWPQLASEYVTLTEDERLAGAETIIKANKSIDAATRPAVVIGVQADNAESAAKFARHADKTGADAIIAIPLDGGKDESKQMDYYATIGASSSKPLFAQAIGNMSVDFILRMSKKIPTLQYVKDEAGSTLPRLTQYRNNPQKLTGVFTGKHGPTFVDELARGAIGNMPAAGFAELYVATMKAWNEGKPDEAEEMFSHTLLLIMAAQAYGVPGQKYILQLRGVFPNTKSRRDLGNAVFDDEAKKAIERTVAYTKRWFKA
jgi:4-hydroxy-tetrahydrodipicolinate synthase